ncbi:aureobasidin resistance protein Aur1 [Rhizophagus clarus]|uniref:Aureobasidin resistance protein Aur1 n=1 Tax=Rhizophagus clarus TaxID=94130 RepID=A0A8H3R4S7_9GLOM|nr:aureobasidin resistance protein Aur1 [Rhizophagus clarus]
MAVFFIEANFLKDLQWKSWLRFTKPFITSGLHYHSWTIYDFQYIFLLILGQVDILAWLPYGVIHFTLPFLTSAGLWWYGPPAEYTMPGHPGGLARIDKLFGTDTYTKTFSGSPMTDLFCLFGGGFYAVVAFWCAWDYLPSVNKHCRNRWDYIKEKNSVLLPTDNNDNVNLLFDSSKFNNNDEYEIEIATTISEGTDLAALTNSESSSKSNTSIDTIGQSFHEVKLHPPNS